MWEPTPCRRPTAPAPAAPAERTCLTAAIGDDPPSSDTDELRP